MTQWSPAFIVPAMTEMVAAMPVLKHAAPYPDSSPAIFRSSVVTVGLPVRAYEKPLSRYSSIESAAEEGSVNGGSAAPYEGPLHPTRAGLGWAGHALRWGWRRTLNVRGRLVDGREDGAGHGVGGDALVDQPPARPNGACVEWRSW